MNNQETSLNQQTNTPEIGRIESIWRYPVKSLRGESCQEVVINDRGLHFDRAYALVNSAGKFGSHKNTRRFARMDNLYQMQAQVLTDDSGNDNVTVVFPDGQHVPVTDREAAARASTVVGQPVTVEAEKQVPHQDMGAIHLLTTASIRWLQQLLPDMVYGVQRFRPNLVVDTPGNTPVEQEWIGRVLGIGDARLMVVEPTERCIMTTLPVDQLPADPRILRTLSRDADMLFGVYARVIRPSPVRVGMAVTLAAAE